MSKKHGQGIDIPPQYDPAKTKILLRDDFAASVAELHEQVKIDHIRDHNHTVAQNDTDSTALANGRRALANKNPSDSLKARKKREKDHARLRTALTQLQDRLEDIYRQIEAISERLHEIDTEINELQRLKELAESGLLDPTNADHAKLLKKYGITQEDIENGNLSVLLAEKLGHRFAEQTELQKRKESLHEQAHEAIADAQAEGSITPEEAGQLRQQYQHRLQSLEAGVSAVAWDSERASQDLKDIAVEHYTNVAKDERVLEELVLPVGSPSSGSVAATLDGEATYKKGIQSQGKDMSLQNQFTAKAKHEENNLDLEEVASNTITPGLKKG